MAMWRWRTALIPALLALAVVSANERLIGTTPAAAQPYYPPQGNARHVQVAGGADPASIQAVVDAFRTDLGGANNGVGGTFPDGRREINWDGVPDGRSSPNNLPADFFNVTSARGVVFATPGSGFQVSANDGVAPVRFATINHTYDANFQVFSPQRLFTALDSPVTEVRFFVPGTDTAATVSGFGAVFTNVRWADAATIEYFDVAGNSLGVWSAPTAPAGGLSFVGVSWSDGARLSRVRITSGTAALSPNTDDGDSANLVAMDDFIYGEPRANGR